jgi:hypothetical protein
MIPGTGETIFYIDLDAVENMADNEVLALCEQLGLTSNQEERLIMLSAELPEEELIDAHCELSHKIRPAHLAVHLRSGVLAA